MVGRLTLLLHSIDHSKMSIQVLVADDSAFMRKAISMMLEKDDEIDVVATANNGKEAIELVKKYQPDLMTLDVEMPGMDGISALERLMVSNPLPVIMVSSLTEKGADATIQAMEAGAVDFIPKNLSYASLDVVELEEELREKVKTIVRSRRRSIRPRRKPNSRSSRTDRRRLPFSARSSKMVVIGISTGGPNALHDVIPKLPGTFDRPIAVVQHMPPSFTSSLAKRLDRASALKVVEARDGMELSPGMVVLAAGGRHMTFHQKGRGIRVQTSTQPEDILYVPSADVMFSSAHEIYGGDLLAVVMTGMGKDGLEGARMIKKSGGTVLTQTEDSCVVYGMPKAVDDAGISDASLSLGSMAQSITRAVTPHLNH